MVPLGFCHGKSGSHSAGKDTSHRVELPSFILNSSCCMLEFLIKILLLLLWWHLIAAIGSLNMCVSVHTLLSVFCLSWWTRCWADHPDTFKGLGQGRRGLELKCVASWSWSWFQHHNPSTTSPPHILGSRDSSVVRVPDSWIKGCRFKSLQKRRETFLLQGQLSVLTLFQYPFHPHVTVTAIACKRSWSFCRKCRWQISAKHTCTLHVWLCVKWHGAWLYGVHRTHWDGSSFMWHQQ